MKAKPEATVEPSFTWSWNVVFVDCAARDSAVEAVQRELAALAEALRGVAPGAVHLHVAITRSHAAGDFYVQTTLKLPETILRADESAEELAEGVRVVFATLREEVHSLLGSAGAAPGRAGAAGAAFGQPLRVDEGPQSRRELVQDLFAGHYDRLLRYARRRLRFYEACGIVPKAKIDPRELVDEAAVQCLEEPVAELPRLDYLVWFHELVRDQLKRFCDEQRDQERRQGEFPGRDEERPDTDDLQGVVVSALEADDGLDGDCMPDAAARSPEEAAEENDLVDLVLGRAQSWPALEREVLVLHFVEGFTAAEIARLERADEGQIGEALARVTRRLRAMLRDEPYLR